MPKISFLKKAPLAAALTLAFVIAGAHAAAPLLGDAAYTEAVTALRLANTPDAKQAAVAELERLATNGEPRAPLELAKMALKDIPFAGDAAYERALRYYQRAVELEAPNAADEYALTVTRRGYYLGKDTQAGHDYLVQALPLLQAQAQFEHPEVLWHLGFLEVTGLADTQDVPAGHKHMEEAAAHGHALAALWTANRYAHAVPAEPEAELRYLKIAAAGGIRGARERVDQMAVARVFENSGRDDAPPGSAMGAVTTQSLIQTATAQIERVSGTVPATSTIVVASAAPVAAPQNSEIDLLRARLEQATRELGDLRARLEAAQERALAPAGLTQDQLVAINNQGLQAVVEGNYEIAIARFRQAAAANYAPAQSNLGLMYLNSTGVPRDVRQAEKLFELAAKKGNRTACENLARIYDFGIGVHKDRSRALHWYKEAQELGSDFAGEAIERLKSS